MKKIKEKNSELRKYRKKLGLTQEAVTYICKKHTQPAISNMEKYPSLYKEQISYVMEKLIQYEKERNEDARRTE
jgi:predicted transcriptional regulator